MYPVILTALGVGGATVFGAIVGFIFKNVSEKYSKHILAFSSGVMLAASFWGLFLPALEIKQKCVVLIVALGLFCGAFCMDLLGRLITNKYPDSKQRNAVILFVAAIAIHNLPEGIAAGVGFGTGSMTDALLIAGAIAMQNLPEGMVIIGPMLASGISPKRTFLYALITGLIEVVGTFIGYFSIVVATVTLPFSLSFAGGTMLYIICSEMIPQACGGDHRKFEIFSIITGFCTILVLNSLL